MKNIAVQKSRNGLGIFTTKDFLPETTVFEVTGVFMTCDADDDIDEQTRSNAYRYDKNRYISPQGRMGDFLNHSCNPNSKIVKRDKKLFIVTIEPIFKGVEVTMDYSTILAADDVWEMECNCGEKQCRGVIKNFTSLPKPLREKYILSGMVPKYIIS